MKINRNKENISESSTQKVIIIDSSSESEEEQKFQSKNPARKRQRQKSTSRKMYTGKRLSKRQKIAAVSEIFK